MFPLECCYIIGSTHLPFVRDVLGSHLRLLFTSDRLTVVVAVIRALESFQPNENKNQSTKQKHNKQKSITMPSFFNVKISTLMHLEIDILLGLFFALHILLQ